MAKQVMAEYKCGCSWVGKKSEMLDYCERHGEDLRRTHPVLGSKIAPGWSFEKQETTNA